MFVELPSVGSMIRIGDATVYPQNLNGTPDLGCGTPAGDCCDGWYESLSEADREVVRTLAEAAED